MHYKREGYMEVEILKGNEFITFGTKVSIYCELILE